MGRSQVNTAHFSNLLGLVIIVLALLLILSVLADNIIPRSYLRSPFVAEVCIGQRNLMSTIRATWLQGIWLSAPPMPITRVTASGTEYNNPGTLCGLIPWFSGTPGMWYREIRANK